MAGPAAGTATSCFRVCRTLNRTMNDLIPLHEMLVRMERTNDMTDSYCTTLTVIRVEAGADKAELRCATCGRHRGWLSPEIAKWLLVLLKHFPAVKQGPAITIRDKDYENPEPDKLHLAHLHALREAGVWEDDVGDQVS
jgi:hypothetical protein